MNTHRVLSTKILSESNRERLIQSNVSLIQADFITTNPLSFVLPAEQDNWVFTSQNAVEAVFSSSEKEKCVNKNVFCVGEKTKSLLIKNNQRVIKMCQNSFELGHFIAKNHENDEFLFCCGSRKKEDLPRILSEQQIPLTEIEVYETLLTPKKIEAPLDGILFYSPSGVESFMSQNVIGDAKGICIGPSTAEALNPYTTNISVATSPTIEHVLLKTIQLFGTYEYIKK
jgi:uroporphyrinogen-III synthase